MKPAGWPRYMTAKRLKSGGTAYYWAPQTRDMKGGCTLHAETLGHDYGQACERAAMLNAQLDAWRRGYAPSGRIAAGEPEGALQRDFLTLDWLVARAQRTAQWQRKSARVQAHDAYILRLALDLPRKSGRRVGEARVTEVDAAAADKLYERLQTGPRGKRLRVANMAIQKLALAWDIVARLHRKDMPADNPFRGCALTHGNGTARPATRAEALALHQALIAAGEPHLAAVPLICFEWHQRPENVLAGSLTWGDWRPPARPGHVRILHAKTGAEVWQPLYDAPSDSPAGSRPDGVESGGELLFPELTAYLDGLERLGLPIVLMKPERRRRDPQTGRLTRAPATLFTLRDARARVRKAARAAGLPDWLTLAACRHGGMTELGDAGATEAEVMASSGHKTPDAARLYVKRTEAQRLSAARKRKALRG